MPRKDQRHRKSTTCADLYTCGPRRETKMFFSITRSHWHHHRAVAVLPTTIVLKYIAVSIQLKKKKSGTATHYFSIPLVRIFWSYFGRPIVTFVVRIRVKVIILCSIWFLICRNYTHSTKRVFTSSLNRTRRRVLCGSPSGVGLFFCITTGLCDVPGYGNNSCTQVAIYVGVCMCDSLRNFS